MYESSDQTLSRFRNSDRPSLQLALDRTVSGAFFGQPVLRNQSTMGFDYGLGLGDSYCAPILRFDFDT
jgi:hypothetical protein